MHFIWDPLGIFFSIATWVLMIFADVVVTQCIFVNSFSVSSGLKVLPSCFPGLQLNFRPLVVWIFWQLCLLFAFLSHLMAIFTDPGSLHHAKAPPEPPLRELEKAYKVAASQNDPPLPGSPPRARTCRECKNRWKPPRAHHCKTCRFCVFRMDHHCPWVNNCVGFRNQKHFINFLMYTALSSGTALFVLTYALLRWMFQTSVKQSAPAPIAVSQSNAVCIICLILVAVECLFFVCFTMDFLMEQFEALTTNSTLVESYQRTHGFQRRFMDHVTEVYGKNWITWLMPVPPQIETNLFEPALPDNPEEMAYFERHARLRANGGGGGDGDDLSDEGFDGPGGWGLGDSDDESAPPSAEEGEGRDAGEKLRYRGRGGEGGDAGDDVRWGKLNGTSPRPPPASSSSSAWRRTPAPSSQPRRRSRSRDGCPSAVSSGRRLSNSNSNAGEAGQSGEGQFEKGGRGHQRPRERERDHQSETDSSRESRTGYRNGGMPSKKGSGSKARQRERERESGRESAYSSSEESVLSYRGDGREGEKKGGKTKEKFR
uniref:Palmitoyltransferase n=1 Tax=Chromera velia CCMP2878 TaxID=1169474 RepID=A0A0G4FG48_9ALVE|eukprot:Cvel_16791.t1-p1 / transcript=Cvel_16791.t1 / gene=Cvel_16791 / organism=Chromera_velia_CCMP2878 / gene_product=Palmitoyltransferase ZDHHC3, putative / transcript_product=Palmitoyltransferase ZDHHC3, putative / location=Cvel_scaffold1311:4375-5997(-) / protein_length=541 / sequence_SO=supercontig / SO=protein_coding / is_pseudo=false